MTTRLIDIAQIIRSKNAGPFELTLDVIFETLEHYELAKASNCFTASRIADLYGLDLGVPISIILFDPAWAIKIVFPRNVPSGNLGDSDIYGAQQHGPLLHLEIGDTRVSD